MSSLPYLGSKIALISNAEIRYEGILFQINTEESTISLQQVRSFGTEGRRTPNLPGSDEIYEFIIFRGKDIKDLFVLEDVSERKGSFSDPAIVTASKPAPKTAPVNYSKPEPIQQKQPYQPRGERRFDDRRPADDRRPYEERRTYEDRRPYQAEERRPYEDRRPYQAEERRPHQSEERRPYQGQRSYERPFPRGRGRGGLANVGQLAPNENKQVKAEVQAAFDFSGANAKFEKPEEAGEAVVRAGYSKVKSFFDDISCDALDRARDFDRSNKRDQLRAVDKETFGAASLNRPFEGARRPMNPRGGARRY